MSKDKSIVNVCMLKCRPEGMYDRIALPSEARPRKKVDMGPKCGHTSSKSSCQVSKDKSTIVNVCMLKCRPEGMYDMSTLPSEERPRKKLAWVIGAVIPASRTVFGK